MLRSEVRATRGRNPSSFRPTKSSDEGNEEEEEEVEEVDAEEEEKRALTAVTSALVMGTRLPPTSMYVDTSLLLLLTSSTAPVLESKYLGWVRVGRVRSGYGYCSDRIGVG